MVKLDATTFPPGIDSPCIQQHLTRSMSAGGAFEEEYEEAAPPKKELFYTEGSALLKQARLHIAHFSLDRAAARLAGAKRKRESPDEDEIAEQADTIRLMRKVLFITLCLLCLRYLS